MRLPDIPTPDSFSDLLTLYFPGRPKTKKNPKSPGRHGGYYNPAKGYEAVIRDHAIIQLKNRGLEPPVFPTERVACFFKISLQNQRCPDAGNLAECILDALQAGKNKESILYQNDNQIDLLIVKRIFDKTKNEGVELTAWRLE